MPRIHYYDVDENGNGGFIHYVSDVVPGLECRVLDAVRNDIDLMTLAQLGGIPGDVWGFVPGTGDRQMSMNDLEEIIAEAVKMSNKGVKFMDAIMTRSPFRDAEKWEREGRAKFMEHRAQRRKRFMDAFHSD